MLVQHYVKSSEFQSRWQLVYLHLPAAIQSIGLLLQYQMLIFVNFPTGSRPEFVPFFVIQYCKLFILLQSISCHKMRLISERMTLHLASCLHYRLKLKKSLFWTRPMEHELVESLQTLFCQNSSNIEVNSRRFVWRDSSFHLLCSYIIKLQ